LLYLVYTWKSISIFSEGQSLHEVHAIYLAASDVMPSAEKIEIFFLKNLG